MKTFTFDRNTADRLLNDLNNGRVVRLAKAHGASIVLSDSYDLDEFGEMFYRFTIESADGTSAVNHMPVNQKDMIDFLFGEEFTEYGIVEY